ncbi:hypothetical protein ABZ726_11040 [Streptomyces hundungensis]|uniref:hypothetical protein n=1 Tax=Streptomyces hundungensis TaxID=1077946 RepID=UPI0033C05F06
MDQPHTTRPCAEGILAAVPGLAPYALPAVVLAPAPGEPAVHQSSVGGPLLWPADEAWPCCDLPDEKSGSGTPATAMVAVAQVYRRDAPGDWWPEGKDVFQLLWCPNVHWDPPAPHADVSPVAEIRWRDSADVKRILTSPPLPVRQEDPDYGYTPVPCTLTPVPLVDFPHPQTLLDGELSKSVQEYAKATGDGSDVITRVAGIKFGGWPTWHLTDPYDILCLTCGAPCHLLFTVASDHTTGITVGRWGDFRIFACPAGEGHGYVFDQH